MHAKLGGNSPGMNSGARKGGDPEMSSGAREEGDAPEMSSGARNGGDANISHVWRIEMFQIAVEY